MRGLGCVAILLIWTTAGLAGGAGDPPLPEPAEVDGWTRAAEPKVWQASGLYGYIDGGAELFLELGFDRLTVATYQQGDDEVIVELYRMNDPIAASGAFLAHSGPPEPSDELDITHTVGRYELQAHAGRYYIKLQNVSGRAQRVEDLLRFARAIVAQIPSTSFEDPTRRLPDQGRIPGSMRIVRGPLGLESIYSLGPGDILSLKPDRVAVAASYRSDEGDRHSRLQVDYGTASEAREALSHLADNLDPYLELLGQQEGRLVFRGYGGDFGLVRRDASRLIVLVGLDQRPELDAKPAED